MFDRIAGIYDLLNSVMTAGLHHRWRRRAAELAAAPVGGAVPDVATGAGGPPARRRAAELAAAPVGGAVLDVATGTGDLAFELARHVGPEGEVVGVDFSEQML